MTTTKRSTLVLTLIIILAAFAFGQTANQKAQIEVEVLAVMTRQSAAWNRGDVTEFMQGYWNSEQLVFASGDSVTRGWRPTLDRYKKTYSSKKLMGELTFSDVEVNVLSKEIAVVIGSWSLVREQDKPRGKFTLIFRRLEEGWRIIHDHTS